jgi:hypothetical protein
MRYTTAGVIPPLASIAFGFVVAASLASGTVEKGHKTIIALFSVLCCWVSAALAVRGLMPFFHIGANLVAHPSLLPLCLAACLQAGTDGAAAGAATARAAAAATASVLPSAPGDKSDGDATVVVAQPLHALEAAPHLAPASFSSGRIAAPRLRIILVHEAEPLEGTPEAHSMEAARAQLRADPKEPCHTFDSERIKALLENMVSFVQRHLGLFCESRTLDAVLGAGDGGGDARRSAAHMTVYVFFVWTPTGMRRRAETCHLETWPTAQCATVTPPFAAVQRDAKGLLSALNVFAGPKCGVSSDSPYSGIVPAIFAAIAAKAGAVLLNTSA